MSIILKAEMWHFHPFFFFLMFVKVIYKTQIFTTVNKIKNINLRLRQIISNNKIRNKNFQQKHIITFHYYKQLLINVQIKTGNILKTHKT